MTLPLVSLPEDPFASVSPSAPSLPRGALSPESSNVVADVEYDPCADELRLPGGDGKLKSPSDPLPPAPLDIDLLSPLPLSRLGVPEPKELFAMLAVDRFSRDPPGVEGLLASIDSLLLPAIPLTLVEFEIGPPESGLEGRLVRATLGGCGNAATLIVLRKLFPPFVPGVEGSGMDLGTGTEGCAFD
jgi:hypothetical protein